MGPWGAFDSPPGPRRITSEDQGVRGLLVERGAWHLDGNTATVSPWGPETGDPGDGCGVPVVVKRSTTIPNPFPSASKRQNGRIGEDLPDKGHLHPLTTDGTCAETTGWSHDLPAAALVPSGVSGENGHRRMLPSACRHSWPGGE